MSDNTKESTRIIAKLPTRLIVNIDTGAADLYSDDGIFGRVLIGTGSAVGNNWTVNDDFVRKYNNRNNTNLTQSQLQQTFAKEYQKTLNNDRAAIVNKYSPYNTKKYLQETAKIPGVINPQTGTKTGDTTSTPTTATIEEEETGDFSSSDIPERTGTETKEFGTWQYPSDLAANQDVIKFTMLKYEPRSFEASQSSGFGFGNRSDTTTRSIGNVTLPIPAGIRDQNVVEWGSKNLNPLEIAAAGIAKAGIEKGMESAIGQMSKTFNKLQGGENNADAQAVASNLIAGAATGIGQQLLTRATGAIINPNMELLFSGPSLRPFNFTFKLSARNQTEADQIIGIIRFFKRGMAAQRSESELFLKSPHTFKLQYLLRGKEDHPYIGQIKECALKSFSVNYTPENNYATYESGLMVSYEITMDLQELEPVFNDEYENIPGIGY